jgi:hypothetical protein
MTVLRRGNLAPLVALAVGAWALAGEPLVHGDAVSILVAAGFVAALALIGVRRSRRERGAVDPFHPLAFPLIYVAFSFLAPAWLAFVQNTPLRGLSRNTPVAHGTVKLLVLGVVGFAAGAAVHFRVHGAAHARTRRRVNPVSPLRLLNLGRGLLLIPLAISFAKAATGTVHHRGAGQLITSPTDTLSALLDPTELTAVVLILAAHRMAKLDRLMARLDWGLVGLLIVLIGLRGSRGNAIALLLVLTLAHVHRRGKVVGVALGAILMVVFGVVVLQYRSAAAGHASSAGAADILLGDMTVAAFSTGATAAVVPHDLPYAHGSTLVAALERQLPGPVAVRLFGPPDDTAARRFRQIIGFSDPNAGIGYSIPAEGYLNFGRLGVFGLCAVLGLLFAWAYGRLDLTAGRATRMLYPVIVGVLPFGLRSDSLAMTKNILYPLIILTVALVISRRRPTPLPVLPPVERVPVPV